MKFHLPAVVCSAWYYLIFLIPAHAQIQFTSSVSVSPGKDFVPKDLFDDNEVLNFRLTGNIHELTTDRDEHPKFHSLILSYKTEDNKEVALSIKAKTRGHFRKTMGDCNYPPILLHFIENDSLRASLFNGQTELKLVMPCRGDEYVVREWLVYKLYALVTPKSFRARLVKVELNDTKRKKTTTPFYGILLEEEEHMATRNQELLLKRKLQPEQVESNSFLTMAVFEYLIGNTDWSVQYLQNIKLLAADSNSVPVTVPYDFDQCGVVNTPYAKPAEELEMSSVLERRYRGYCVQDISRFDSVVAIYDRLRKDIYSLYTGCALLDAKYIKTTVLYFDQFYKTINDPAALKKEFSYPCDKTKTGNVIIKGLKD